MGHIIVLDENTSNKIAAGEVVEKPASVVKELVENSIDAGATSISVDIKNGGISYIKVTDNGSGMDEDDVEIAFERHATSKIKRAEDLDSISTMGFRGEALASIAAVSSVELQTRAAGNTYGMYVHISGGTLREVRQTGCPVGTTFIIRDLFYNTPARYKFLKKDSTEAGYISDTISRIALGNPEISFKLTSGKALLLHTPGNNDVKSAIYSIYGKEIIKELIEVGYQDEKYKITGYIGKPEAARANRNYQSLYINRRYVKSKMVSYAVEQAYTSILMKNKFPFFVLNIELNPLLVDANVSPAKTEVRFAEESYLSRAIYMAVSKALSSDTLFNPVTVPTKDREIFKFKGADPKPDYVQEELRYNFEQKAPEGIQVQESKSLNAETDSPSNSISVRIPEQPADKKDITAALNISTRISEEQEIRSFTEALKPLARTDISSSGRFPADLLPQEQGVPDNYIPVDVDIPAIREETIPEIQNAGQTASEEIPKKKSPELDLTAMKYIGQAFSTYIILQNGEELVLVDQHAAHERIIYEKLKIKYEEQVNTTQLLLEPAVIQFQPLELNEIRGRQEMLNKIGFVFEDFGNNSIIIRGIPYLLEGCSPKDVFLELADKIFSSLKPVATPLADEIIHTIACKAAIKANRKLNDSEVTRLLEELASAGSRYTCPHGRPTVIRLTKYEIEKMFKRIV
ncbi:DNA mismatch repair endonuclease MutL [Ruminiclostridium cellobioparum]|uniref:DNA mismatch repair protein MutL n=1 Tax=Ruminiclostridium cellobioparum subsp. termitidis CT1112 TaxID=1195236 RepID=S0FS13_RUMCE|nr:DNA mismatch repair endonuclease MutL [Ruminiclostridium cellobioparum]EMS73136.1 DNA mismatch repair protein MutL [Ruminiclostridium cellobioparum subsp. termitidis CT1112]